MKDTVIAIVGPTAAGKSALGIHLANDFDGEVISGDSMQIYKGMDIGTAKISEDEKSGIRHHLLDIKMPDHTYSAADFKEDVTRLIPEITLRGHFPIITGGSGLYIQAALYDYAFPQHKRDTAITDRIRKELEAKGADHLHQRLYNVDPQQAAKIHPNNHRRLIRALEVYEATGRPMSAYESKEEKPSSPYDVHLIGLDMDRKMLHEKINRRVDRMVQAGLTEEVKRLYDAGYGDSPAMKAIGYKEFIPYLEGNQSLETTIAILKRNTRRYAKRQLTWFKNKMDVRWYNITPGHENHTFRKISADLAGIQQER